MAVYREIGEWHRLSDDPTCEWEDAGGSVWKKRTDDDVVTARERGYATVWRLSVCLSVCDV